MLNKYHSKNQCPDTDNQSPEENGEDESILSSQPGKDSNQSQQIDQFSVQNSCDESDLKDIIINIEGFGKMKKRSLPAVVRYHQCSKSKKPRTLLLQSNASFYALV